MSDWFQHVPADTWPGFDIDAEELERMFGQWCEYWPGAVASLSETVVPDEVTKS